jgi:predicted TIM-barrel fold metal-dependent hydrolase
MTTLVAVEVDGEEYRTVRISALCQLQGIYEGQPELLGASWAFTVETATHALRLMTSGLFDRFPKLTIILGHLGETLPLRHLAHRPPSEQPR